MIFKCFSFLYYDHSHTDKAPYTYITQEISDNDINNYNHDKSHDF